MGPGNRPRLVTVNRLAVPDVVGDRWRVSSAGPACVPIASNAGGAVVARRVWLTEECGDLSARRAVSSHTPVSPGPATSSEVTADVSWQPSAALSEGGFLTGMRRRSTPFYGVTWTRGGMWTTE